MAILGNFSLSAFMDDAEKPGYGFYLFFKLLASFPFPFFLIFLNIVWLIYTVTHKKRHHTINMPMIQDVPVAFKIEELGWLE
jgi:hypothetical protein